jgi:hypothetical protein
LYKKKSDSQDESVCFSGRYSILNNQITHIDTKLTANCIILNKKYSTLKDQINKLFKIIEEGKSNKVDKTYDSNEEIKSFELKIKSLLIADQSNLQNFYNDIISNIETRISKFNQNLKKERNITKNILEELKNKVEVFILKRIIHNLID